MVPKNYVLHAEPGSITTTGHPVGFVVEGDPDNPDGRRVVSSPASGGQSSSTVDSNGDFSLHLDAPLDVGTPGEPHVLKILIRALGTRGDTVSLPVGSKDLRGGAKDSCGEDGLICLNGKNVPVQIVSVPAGSDIWRELAQRKTTTASGTLVDAVGMIRAAFEKKRTSAKGSILVLDVGHLGAVVTPRLIASYWETHGDPVAEFELREAWVIGATVRSSFQFVAPVGARR